MSDAQIYKDEEDREKAISAFIEKFYARYYGFCSGANLNPYFSDSRRVYIKHHADAWKRFIEENDYPAWLINHV